MREGGEHGLPGLRAIGVELAGGVAQVSMNVERPFELSLAEVVRRSARHAPIAEAELVGLAPAPPSRASPRICRCPGFDPARHVIENASRLLTMAQTRRKRQTKHRGNAAGVVESRGRTGRKPTAAEKSGKAQAAIAADAGAAASTSATGRRPGGAPSTRR